MVTTRKMSTKDRIRVYKLLQNSEILYPQEISKEMNRIDQVLFEPRQYHSLVIIAQTEVEEVAGYATYGKEPLSANRFELFHLTVSPLALDRRIEDLLISYIEQDVKLKNGKSLITRVSSDENNSAWRDFLYTHKYNKISIVKNYYDSGIDQLLLCKQLG